MATPVVIVPPPRQVIVKPGGVSRPAQTEFGDQTIEGAWRIRRSGSDLVFERLESGVFVEKGSFTAV